MATLSSSQSAPSTTAKYEAQFDLLMQEATRLNELMAKDRIEIERLKAETKEIRDQTRTMLICMGAEI